MRVLIISDIVDRERIILQLKDLCEGTSLILFNDIEKARDFINDQVVKQQLPLDLIITYSSIGKRPSNDFRDFIRADYKRTYSKKDFNIIESLPLYHVNCLRCIDVIFVKTKKDDNTRIFKRIS
jgi:hypothetical protein